MKSTSVLSTFGYLGMLAAIIATTNHAFAEQTTEQIVAPQHTPELDQVTVWGTQVRASSIDIPEETLAIKQADHISDLLRTIPGVDVGGAHSLNQRITIRSMDDKDLRISIDGANQNTYMYHHMGNLQIHADILQSIDVEVGTNSVVNGGLGGAVRFETKTAKQLLRNGERFGARVQSSYGDNSGKSNAITGYAQLTDSIDVLAYYNSVDRDNYDVGEDKIKDANGDEIPGTNGTVKGLEGDLDDVLIKFGWDVSDNQRLELGFETYKDEGNYSYRPDMGLATDLAITNSLMVPLLWPTEFTRDTLTLNYDLEWGGHSKLKAALFTNKSELERDESGWAANPAYASWAGQIEGEAENKGFNLLAETDLETHTLTYGVEIIRYDTDYKAVYVSSTDSSSEKASSHAVFLQDRIQLTDKLAIIPGIRFDSYDIESAVVDDRFNEFTGALAAEYELTDNLLVKVSTTQLFKGPEIGEVFTGAGLFDTANQDIDEETGLNSELSLAFEDAVLGADQFLAGITLFQTDIDDYIYDYAPPPPSVGGRSWKDNVGDMRIDGIEAYLGYNIGNLRTLITYSSAESSLDAASEYTQLDNARLDRQQGDTVSINIDYEIPDWNLALHWDSLIVDDVDSHLDLDGASLYNGKDDYNVHNISMRWTPETVRGLAITFGVDNLFDKFYTSQSSRTGVSFHPLFGQLYLQDFEPGRNIKMTASFEF
jgi:hemoglobin/transferrin/lactoferrin receptor protein